ncbi:MAG: YfiR family protein [Bacteroidales bacterium]|nr:YfiR family protein [Bacteroidales bacterium]
MLQITFFIQILIIALFSPHQNINTQNFDYQSIIKFSHYVYWPEENENNNFVIYIATNSEQKFNDISSLLINQNFNGKNIIVNQYTDQSDISNAQVIFIEKNSSVDLNTFKEKIDKKKILTLSNDENLLNYGCMFYVNQKEDYIDYLFKKQTILDSGLLIRTSLLSNNHIYNNE